MLTLQEIIAGGESGKLEFKKRITKPDRIARTMAAFANTAGGLILVGVMDNGDVSGIDPEEEKFMLQRAATDFCRPPVKLIFKEVEEETLTILKVIVPESSAKPHKVKVSESDWRIFVRVNDETVQVQELPETKQY